jgi:hypothetical protein
VVKHGLGHLTLLPLLGMMLSKAAILSLLGFIFLGLDEAFMSMTISNLEKMLGLVETNGIILDMVSKESGKRQLDQR